MKERVRPGIRKNITPPRYDVVFFDAMKTMNEEEERWRSKR